MSRRRAYPQPHYENQPDPSAAYGIPQAPAPGQPGLGAGAPAGGFTVATAPGAGVYGQSQQQQYQQQSGQVNQLAQGFSGLNINDQDSYGQQQQQQQFQSAQSQSAYGYPQPGYQSPGAGGAYGQQSAGFTPNYGGQPAAGGAYGQAGRQQQPTLPLNQLYSTDLLKELPPPISDLAFPPPPIIVSPDLAATGKDCNPSPEYFRSTLNVVPTTSALLKKSKLPFALILKPYSTLSDSTGPVPIVEDSIVTRCRRCRSYMNPFIQFTENGRRWRCNFCGLQNDVPQAFDFNPATSAPANRMDRHELNHSVVEFAAPKEYMVRPPQPLIYVFVLDVSQASIQNGLLATISRTILDSLDRIPNDDGRSRVAFLAVDSSISFFEIPTDEDETKEISMMIVSDLDEVLIPSPDGIMANLRDSRKNIEKLLTNFPSYFANNQNPGFALGPALKSAHHLISQIGGKIVVFSSTLPNVGEGKLTVRDEASVSGSSHR
ncbi:unnamed protein product [Ambrosiozyma monospora]|uniref:Unnamed protein product n=1 Tax=Ambrosiozyma monospora TaxID=43982 RepID=A0A9W6Z6P3_AMBMO|nr:unnamed protein product [Ambrosiozyma monospora]